MKKFLLTTMLLLFGMATWAQNDWVAPSENQFPNSTPVYVQVKVNGVENQQAVVAAFIDGECRAVAAQPMNNGLYRLRVYGDNTTEFNKDIQFKVKYQDIVYSMKKTVKFTGETHTEIPFVLNLDVPTGLTLTNPLEIEAKLPYTHDLTSNITFTYQGFEATGAPVDYQPLGESTIETALTYNWDFANSSQFFTVEGNQLTATTVTEEYGAYLGLTIYPLGLSAFTTVYVSEPVVPVESIVVNPNQFTISIYDNLYEVEQIHQAITVLPADASNPSYRFVAADDAAAAVFEGGSFTDGGTYNINVVSEANENIYATIQVTVVVPVEAIRLSSPSSTFYAVPGENVYDLIRPYVTVEPANATNQQFHFIVPESSTDGFTQEGAATKAGLFSLMIAADADTQIRTEVDVVVNQIVAPAQITLNVGDYYGNLLGSQIQVLPNDQDVMFNYEITPKTAADAEGFNGQQAVKSGTYTLLVTCVENPKATAEIVVKVVTPVTIVFPSQFEMSTSRDTYLQLTLVEGDDFDPALLEFEFNSNSDFSYLLGEPQCTLVEGSNGLKWKLRAFASGTYGLSVKYNGNYMLNTEGEEYTECTVGAEVAFNAKGWDWIYIPGYISLVDDQENYLSWLNVDVNNRVIDLRSQTALLYNDETFGLFGDITEVNLEDGMYKIKAAYEDAADAMFNTGEGWDNSVTKMIFKGYNWIGYPHEWDMSLADYNRYIREYNGDVEYPATEGDQIIGKEGFIEFDGSEWVGSPGFYFQKGKGYLYYSETEGEKRLDLTEYPVMELTNRMEIRAMYEQAKRESVWKYDAGAFADNMAIVAEVEGLDCPDDYTIGAFVNGECRGEGAVVKDGKMMISVAGKAGETVNFRLYNKFTDEYFDLNESLPYTGRVGSLRAPFMLTGNDVVSGIEQVGSTAGMTLEAIYDMDGRRVTEMTQGIYIVKMRQGDKMITKKIIK